MTTALLLEHSAAIRTALEAVTDPDLGVSLGDLGALHNVEIHGLTVSVYIHLIQPLHYIAEQINKRCEDAVRSVVPGVTVEIFVRERSPEKQAQNPLVRVKNCIAVASGKGGVGKSTVAANLAAALMRKGATVGFVDADIHGPSAPTLFHCEGEQMVAEKDESGRLRGHPIERYGIKLASMGFIMDNDQAAIMRGPMQAGYVTTFIEQIEWGDLDYLIFDLPPGTGDIQLTLAQRVQFTGAVIVTTPQQLALADVRRGITMFRRVNVEILGVVETMSYYALPDGTKDYIFGSGGGKSLAEELTVPFLGEIPLNVNIREGGDEGKPIVLNDKTPIQQQTMMDFAARVAAEVRRANYRALQVPTVQISL